MSTLVWPTDIIKFRGGSPDKPLELRASVFVIVQGDNIVCMNHTCRDRNATAAYHVALDETCYHTDSDLGRAELFASFALFTIPISASFTMLEDPIDLLGKVQI